MRVETKKRPKLIILLGPTCAGKTEWSLRLAKKFNGDVISADSRQIFKKMNIGTAKAPGEWRWVEGRRTYYVDDVPHHLIDALDPGAQFTVAQFRDLAVKYIKLALRRGRQPMVVGGTGLYISALVDNLSIPRVPPNRRLRRSLEQKSAAELMTLLRALDSVAAAQIDPNNKRRVIRALEVSIMSGEPFSAQRLKGEPLFEACKIGVILPRPELEQRIEQRVDSMVARGLFEEVAHLVKQKYGWSLPSMSAIGYRQFFGYFEGWLSREQVIALLKRDTKRFARRQMSWFRRDPEIRWCRTYEEGEGLVANFLVK